MELGRIAVRALVAFLYLLVVTRASGKRVIGQATPFDFVIALILGDLVDDAVWAEVSMAKFAAGTGTIAVCDAVTKIGAFHSLRFFHLVNGMPVAVLRDGTELGDELRKEQLNEEDLAHLLRKEGIAREQWNDVHLAVLDRDHDLSVILKPEAEPATKQELPR